MNEDAPTPTPEPENILEEAGRLTSGDRRKSYRHPSKHFGVTIGLINELLGEEYLKKPLPLSMWPRMMILDKLARSLGGYKRDHPVDVAGYARTWEMVEERAVDPA